MRTIAGRRVGQGQWLLGGTRPPLVAFVALALLGLGWLSSAPEAVALQSPELTADQTTALRREFSACQTKRKGPFSENFCVCRKTGQKRAVMDSAGRITSPCGNDAMFCAAFRAPWAEALGKEGVWIANIFSRDLWLWNDFPNHHDLVRGYILEKYFVDTNPGSKLAELRSYGGLSGSEYETVASTLFFERYLDEPGFNDGRHFPLAYELQRRYFVRDDLGQVEKVRNLAVRIQAAQPKFKPLRDAIHNRLSESLLPTIAAYRDAMSPGAVKAQVEEVYRQVEKLTALDEGALRDQLVGLQAPSLRAELLALLPTADTAPVPAAIALGEFMLRSRRAVAERTGSRRTESKPTVSTADARRLIDLDVTAGAVLQGRGAALLESKNGLSVRHSLELLSALSDAAYGAGLLFSREQEEARRAISRLLASETLTRAELSAGLSQVGRVVEWAQINALMAYAEVWPRWTLLMPQVVGIGDDVLRSSPLLLFAQLFARLDDYASGSSGRRHQFFGKEIGGAVRVLNPGLAVGRLRINPEEGQYTRTDILALGETPAELQPAAGILTQGEGNILSHVQLLSRSLGIPNVVLGPSAFAAVRGYDGEMVFLAATPGGRVVLKNAAEVTTTENAVWAEFTGNDPKRRASSFGVSPTKLPIDTAKIDLSQTLPVRLDKIRRSDSGRICGPKGAFLGELTHLFPDKVARGLVVPFGAFREHYDRAKVIFPTGLSDGLAMANQGEPLRLFVERVFAKFFDEMIPAGRDAKELADWIAPRLEIIRTSIRETPLSPALKVAIREGLAGLGLLVPGSQTQTVGCFVRSDTNVEDLDSFNGAGLNLTIFNMGSLADIDEALQKVWASPFELRSFSWRQTLIDQPLWVLPSVVILESIPSDKSGVLVTCDMETGERDAMVIATSEGVGGAVDGTSAETLRWSPTGVDLLSLYKSPWRNDLLPHGGTRRVPSSGRDAVLSSEEVTELVAVGQEVARQLEPARDATGRERAWDIEFGFAGNKLWLFQSRPFLGNESVKNLPVLGLLDQEQGAVSTDRFSLEEVLR